MTEPAQPVSGSRKERRLNQKAAEQPSTEATATVEVVDLIDAYPETLREVASKIRRKYKTASGSMPKALYLVHLAMNEFANGLDEVAKDLEVEAVEAGICGTCGHPFWKHVEPLPNTPQPCGEEGCSCTDYNGPYRMGYLSGFDVQHWHASQ